MVISQITSGLGNQLFQYAAARRLSYVNNLPLKLDLSYYDLNNDRNYCLSQFRINAEIASDEEIWAFKRHHKNSLKRKLRNHILNPSVEWVGRNHVYERPSGLFCRKILRINKPVYIEGYWQHEDYFKNIRDLLKSEVSLKIDPGERHQLLKKEITLSDSVSVHVRRGDYLINPNFAVCGPDYFSEAIRLIEKKVKEPVFFVFSDDLEWARQNIKTNSPVKFVDFKEPKEFLDLDLMRFCKNNIISNSTFSWWGAWLNMNPSKIVISPLRWANNSMIQKKYSQNGFIPAGWITI